MPSPSPAVGQRWMHRRDQRVVTIVKRNPEYATIASDQRTYPVRIGVLLLEYDFYDTGVDMPRQLELDLGDLVTPVIRPDMSIQEAFEAFHAANPWVLGALERLTEDWLGKGHRRVGIGMLTEILRWQHGRRTTGDAFKLNNNYRSRYVRMMLRRHPEWEQAFETRELRAS